MKFGICNEIFAGWPLERTFAFARQAGYDAVEIAPYTIAKRITDLSPADRAKIRESAKRAGSAISGLHWLLVQVEGMHLTDADDAVRRRTARYFVDLVNACADLGGNRLILGSPKQRNLAPGVSPEVGWQRATDVLRDAVRCAEDRGAVLCLEPLAPNETNFINTAEEARRFTAQFASPAMSIILDVKAMCAEPKPIPQIVRESAGSFAYFHANDANLKGPGFGDTDFRPIVAALREVAYDGMVSVEVFKFEEGPEAIATRSREYLRQVFGA